MTDKFYMGNVIPANVTYCSSIAEFHDAILRAASKRTKDDPEPEYTLAQRGGKLWLEIDPGASVPLDQQAVAEENAVAARSNARAEDFTGRGKPDIGESSHIYPADPKRKNPLEDYEAWASKVFIGDFPPIHKRCAGAAWQARQPEIDALKAESLAAQQVLARALGTGNGIIVGDCQEIGGTADDVCTGEHTLETLAELAAKRIAELQKGDSK
jgi:hypothetical protein